MALPGRRNLRQAIEEHGGVISNIATHFGASRQTIYNWLDHYDMRGVVTDARQKMRDVAQDVVYQRLMDEDDNKAFEAARFVMLHLRNDGELLALSPEAQRLMAQLGVEDSEIVAAVEMVLKQRAMEATRSE